MTTTRPGIERITRQELRFNVARLAIELHSHKALCGQCSKAASDVYDNCKEWWNIARALHRNRRNLRKYDLPESYTQPTLPGLEFP